jgi:integrase
MTNPSWIRAGRKDVVSDDELELIQARISSIENPFYRMRTGALIPILRLVGKRRGEIVTLELTDFEETPEILNVTFTLEKKRKGNVMSKRVTKGLPLSDPLTPPIIEWIHYLKTLDPAPKYFLPATKLVFGKTLKIYPDDHIEGRQALNLFREVSDMAWPHLMRETVGAEIIKRDPTVIGVFKVKQRLDHDDVRTSLRYLERYATDIINREK